MDQAKTIYMRSTLKQEVPTFTEINCDGFSCTDDVPLMKVEPMEHVIVKLEVESLAAEANAGANPDVEECDDFHSNDSNDEDESGVSLVNELTSERTVAAAIELANENIPKTKITKTTPSDSDKTVGEHLENLVPNYMDMVCEVCSHPFESLATAIGHYRRTHNQRGIIVKCCQRRVDLYDMVEHIQYHLNPDIFK